MLYENQVSFDLTNGGADDQRRAVAAAALLVPLGRTGRGKFTYNNDSGGIDAVLEYEVGPRSINVIVSPTDAFIEFFDCGGEVGLSMVWLHDLRDLTRYIDTIRGFLV